MSNYQGFNKVELKRPERSMFDLSHEKRLSTKMGVLTPCLIKEVVPNDTFKCKTEMLIRFAPTLAPVMHRFNAFIHYFFIPTRLLHEDYEDFFTAGRLGDQEPILPYFTIGDYTANVGDIPNTIADYLGLPNELEGLTEAIEINALPFAAFYKVWYDYYRDRNFIADNDLLPLPSGQLDLSEPLNLQLFVTKYRNWQHDYFTSSLPFTQRGQEVLMPMQGLSTINYLDETQLIPVNNTPLGDGVLTQGTAGQLTNNVGLSGSAGPVRVENLDSVEFQNGSVTINDLRQAARLQEWLERNAVAGSRYNETIMAHFGRKTSDSRLQRAEYLGGGKVTIKINEVVNTAWGQDAEANTIPAGTMNGHAIAYTETPSFKQNFEEWGFVVGILSVMPISGYQQGLDRMFLRKTFLDYPWPVFAHLGEQPVYDVEVFANATTGVNPETQIFGYQSRYADWKHALSTSHGDFRSSLNFWHANRIFENAPNLGQDFNLCLPEETQRIFAVQSAVDNIWVYMYHDLKVTRALPYFGTPEL